MNIFWRSLAIFGNDRFRVSEAKNSHDFLRHSSDDDSEAENGGNDSDGSAVDQEDEELAPYPRNTSQPLSEGPHRIHGCGLMAISGLRMEKFQSISDY